MIILPIEKKKPEQTHREFNLMCDRLGNNFNDDKCLNEEEEVKEIISLYKQGIFLDVFDYLTFISNLEPLSYYKLMLILTKNSKHNRSVFLEEFGTLDNPNSEINKLLK